MADVEMKSADTKPTGEEEKKEEVKIEEPADHFYGKFTTSFIYLWPHIALNRIILLNYRA